MITPNYDKAIFRLVPTIFQECFKRDLLEEYEWAFTDKRIKSKFSECEHAVILLIDCLGAKNLHEGFYVTELFKEHGFEVSSVFPTLTANACVSIYLGLPPEESGVIAQRFFARELGAYLDALRGRVVHCDVPLSRAGVRLEYLLWKRGIIDLFDALVIELLPKTIPAAGLSDFYSNVARMNWLNFVDLIYFTEKLMKWLKNKSPSILFIYIPDIDVITHEYGPNSDAFKLQLKYIDSVISNLIKILAKAEERTMLFIISDHGAVEIKETFVANDDAQKKLEEMKVDILISGRFAFIYAEEVDVEKLESFFQNHAKIVPIHDLIRKKFWPAISNENLERFLERAGDYVLIPNDNTDVYIGTRKKDVEEEIRGLMKGDHGGAMEEEMKAILIPLNPKEL